MRPPDRPSKIPHWKHGLDLFLVIVLLPMLLPAAMAIATWVKLSSPGPLLFRQQRIGKDGKPFTLYKLRSMMADAPVRVHETHFTELVKSNRPMQKLDSIDDSRLIPGGSFLRSTGLDELPQLINVVRGEMSLVGPRPCLPAEDKLFTGAQRERFETAPGMTGYWQVNGKNQTTFTEMIELDIHYLRNRSLWLDLVIILRTPGVLFAQLMEQLAGSRSIESKIPLPESPEPRSSFRRQHSA